MCGTPCMQQGRPAQSEWINDVGARLQEAMSECFEKKSLVKFEHVDIGHKLEKRGMLDIWPTEVSGHRDLCLNTFVFLSKINALA